MRAVVFRNGLAKLAATRLFSSVPGIGRRAFTWPTAPIRMEEVPEPGPPAPGWVRLRTRLCGICGSDAKQVALHGTTDNPMTGLVSFPQVLGHEVVASVEAVGPGVEALAKGQRVLLNPWLSCEVRGLDPADFCTWCLQGEFAQCLRFSEGTLAPGIHHGNSRDAPGGFAPLLPAHATQCLAIPDAVSDEAAVLGDPFAVSLHAVLHHPPPEGGTALLYGCGTLGLLAIAILRRLHPGVRIFAVARFDHQAALARRLGAHEVFAHRPRRALVDRLAERLEVGSIEAWRGLPMLNGGVDVVYDTVTSPETLEVGVRVTRSRGAIVALGVEPPKRFEWTPLYFKELSLVGSNAFGMETVDGYRQHAMRFYLDWVEDGSLDVTAILTHSFRLEAYREAFQACLGQGESGAVKVVFDHREPLS